MKLKANVASCAILAVLLLIFAQCAPVDECELYGLYFVKYDFGVEWLALDSSGAYEHRFVAVKNLLDTIEQSGSWKLYTSRDSMSQVIILSNALAITSDFCTINEDYAIPFDGNVHRGVHHSTRWSDIQLATGCEGLYMDKIK